MCWIIPFELEIFSYVSVFLVILLQLSLSLTHSFHCIIPIIRRSLDTWIFRLRLSFSFFYLLKIYLLTYLFTKTGSVSCSYVRFHFFFPVLITLLNTLFHQHSLPLVLWLHYRFSDSFFYLLKIYLLSYLYTKKDSVSCYVRLHFFFPLINTIVVKLLTFSRLPFTDSDIFLLPFYRF